MARQAKLPILPAKAMSARGARIVSAPQKTSATFEVGAPVKMSAGYVVAIATTTSKGTGSTLTEAKKSSINNILGFSLGDAEASSTGNLNIAVVEEGAEFLGNVIHGTQASAKAAVTRFMTDGTSTVVRLAKVTASETHWGWSVDAKSKHSSSGASIVQGVITQWIDPASTVNGRVVVRITKGGALIL